jgi:hypothetical protein
LNSQLPSSLDQGSQLAALTLGRKQQQRIAIGRGNVVIGPPGGNLLHDLQKQHSLTNSSGQGIPPLKGSVESAPGAAEFAANGSLFSEEQEDLAMSPPNKSMTLREMEAKGTWDKTAKSIYFKKENWAKVMEQIRIIKGTNQEVTAENKTLRKEYAKMSEDHDKLANEYDKLAEEYKELEESLKVVSKKKRGQGTKGRNIHKAEQKEDIKKKINEYVKAVLFRTHKFVLPGPDLEKATMMVWDGIKDSMELDKGPNRLTADLFVKIYDSAILESLSTRRQYHQGRCWIAARGTKFV